MRRGWLDAFRPHTPETDAADLEAAVANGESAALFLKRPPHVLEGIARGKIEGDRLIRALFDVQRRGAARVLLVPQVFVWSRSAGTRGGNNSKPALCPARHVAARPNAGRTAVAGAMEAPNWALP